MPPILDALQTIFPDITSPVASVVDEPAVVPGGTEQGNLQLVEDGNKSYSSRMAAINSKVSTHQRWNKRILVCVNCSSLYLSTNKLLCSTQLLWTTSVISSSTFCLNKSRLTRQMKMRLYKQTLVGSSLHYHLVQNTGLILTQSLLCRVYSWLEEGWPAHQRLSSGPGPSTSAASRYFCPQ